jgi:SAM-dependent methyltransferase
MLNQTAENVGTTTRVIADHTKGTSYERLVTEEIQHFCELEVTEALVLGGLHDTKSWSFTYNYYYDNVFKTHFYKEVAEAASRFRCPRILSIGCGFGGHELMIARALRKPFEIVAVDLNDMIFREAQRRADAEGLNIRFQSIDLNFLDLQPASFDVIYAIASIHHVLNLEHLFETLHRGLSSGGRFILLDIIGQRQVLFWKENVAFAAKMVRKMPRQFRPVSENSWKRWLRGFDPYSILPRYADPSDQIGMEGIRQDEIESLLGRHFQAEKAFRYNAFMRLICTNPHLGPLLDPAIPDHRRFLETLINTDYQQVQSGKLRATELFGVFTRR